MSDINDDDELKSCSHNEGPNMSASKEAQKARIERARMEWMT